MNKNTILDDQVFHPLVKASMECVNILIKYTRSNDTPKQITNAFDICGSEILELENALVDYVYQYIHG